MDHPNPAVGNQDAEYGKWRLPRSEVPQQSLASDWLCMKPWLLEVPVVAIMITTFTTSSQPAPRKDCIEKKLSHSHCTSCKEGTHHTNQLHRLQNPGDPYDSKRLAQASTCKLLIHQYEQTHEVLSLPLFVLGAQCSPIKLIQIM